MYGRAPPALASTLPWSCVGRDKSEEKASVGGHLYGFPILVCWCKPRAWVLLFSKNGFVMSVQSNSFCTAFPRAGCTWLLTCFPRAEVDLHLPCWRRISVVSGVWYRYYRSTRVQKSLLGTTGYCYPSPQCEVSASRKLAFFFFNKWENSQSSQIVFHWHSDLNPYKNKWV